MMDFHVVFFIETCQMMEMAFTELHCRDPVSMMNDISINAIVDRFLHYTCFYRLAFLRASCLSILTRSHAVLAGYAKESHGVFTELGKNPYERSSNNYRFNNGSPKKWGNNPVMDQWGS